MLTRTPALPSAALTFIVAYPCVAGDESAAGEPLVKHPSDQKSESFPDGATCLKGAVLSGDPSKGASVLVIKATSGCRVPWHWHSSAEHIVVTAGVGRLEMKDARPSTVSCQGRSPARGTESRALNQHN